MISLTKGAVFIIDIFACITFWRCFTYLLRQYLTRRATILYDLPNLGQPRPNKKRIKGTAVVCGGSFSGLWSARFLSDHFEDVLIIDPEEWLQTPEGCTPVYDAAGELIEGSRVHVRARVSQYMTTHAFQPITYAVLKLLYPSVDDEIRRMDGRIGVSDFCAYLFDTKLMRASKTTDGEYIRNLYLSRESLERLLRRLVTLNTPRIRWMSGTVKGFQMAKGSDVLSSVSVRGPDGRETPVAATLVVDCTGPTRVGLRCLQRLNARATKSAGNSITLDDPKLRVSYCTNQQTRTFYFPIPSHMRAKLPIPGGYENSKWLYTFTPFLGKGRKSVFVDRVEGHRIRIMVGTWGELPLPTLDELREFFDDFDPLQRLPKWLLNLIDVLLTLKGQAELLTSKYPVLSKIQYEKASYIPSNFVAIGDAVLQVNPTFGQGCSKALVGAIVLDSILRSTIDSTEIPIDFSKRFFKEQTRKTAIAWDGTKPIDYAFPTATPIQGEELSDEYRAYKIFISMLLLSENDEHINDAIFRAFNFLGAPSELMQPSILAKVVLLWVRQRLGLTPDYLKN